MKITGSNKFRIYQDHDEDNFHEFVVHNEHMISNYILRYFKYDICELSSENQTLSYLTLNYVSVIYYGPVDDEKFNVFK